MSDRFPRLLLLAGLLTACGTGWSGGDDLAVPVALLKRGEYREARQSLGSLRFQDPELAWIVDYLSGIASWNLGEMDRALEDLQTAASRCPSSVEIHLMLALLLEDMGNAWDAHSEYALALNASDSTSAMARQGIQRTRGGTDGSDNMTLTIQSGDEGLEVVREAHGEPLETGLRIELKDVADRTQFNTSEHVALEILLVNEGADEIDLFERPRIRWNYHRLEGPDSTNFGGSNRLPAVISRSKKIHINPGDRHFYRLPAMTPLTAGQWEFEVLFEIPSSLGADNVTEWFRIDPLTIEVVQAP